MEACVFPIELIVVICEQDYANWYKLVRLCKATYRHLIGLRWSAKCATIRTKTRKHNDSDYPYVTEWWLGRHNRRIYYEIVDDYWNILSVNRYIDYGTVKGELMDGEFINFKYNTFHWYSNGDLIGFYMSWRNPGNKYVVRSSENGRMTLISSTKQQIMAKLDSIGFKYNWLHYLPHDDSKIE